MFSYKLNNERLLALLMLHSMNQVDRLLINLKIIASTEPYQKLNTKSGHQLVIEPSLSTTSIYRWFRDDTRYNTVKRIGEILEEANNILCRSRGSCLGEHVTDEYRSRLMLQLKETRVGLHNLRTTYESDRTITAHFDVLLERIDTMLLSRSSGVKFACAAVNNKSLKINTMSSDDSSSGGNITDDCAVIESDGEFSADDDYD